MTLMWNSMIEVFLHHIEERLHISSHNKILLAVSGGLDSVVMTHLFQAAELQFGIAHCNFQLRGADSDADEKFVAELTKKMGKKFYFTRFETEKYKIENKLSIEEAARNLRYLWLESIRNSNGYQYIATAHHLTDSFETTLLNLIKGSGIKGLKGISIMNEKVIRPMMFATRKEIESFGEKNKILHRTDLSNYTNAFTRNKIRNIITPKLKEINPSIENTFRNTYQNLQEANEITETFIAKRIKKITFDKHKAKYASIAAIHNSPFKNSLLFYLLKPAGFNAEQILQIGNNLTGSGKVFHSKTHRAIIDRKHLIITLSKEESIPVYFIEEPDCSLQLNNCKFVFTHIQNIAKSFKPSADVAYFNLQKITFPISVRRWNKGDYLYPISLYKANGNPAKKKVSDLFIDAKYNLLQKEHTWIILSGEKIIWVAGLRQDEKTKCTPGNSDVLKIKLLPGKESNIIL